MFELSIDLRPLITELSLSEKEMKSFSGMILDRVADAYMYKWNKIVSENLRSTRATYQRGMDFRRIDDFNGVAVLEGKDDTRLALMIEEGATAYDMKEGFEKSDKVKTSADGGWYLTIPFRHATPEALGESAVFSGKQMPQRVYEIAKENAGSPVTFEQLPAANQKLGMRAEVKSEQKVWAKYEHKTPIYQGLQQKTKAQHSQYFTFRRVSDKSDPDSWIHKGFSPHKFMEKALQELETEIGAIIQQAENDFLTVKFQLQ